MYSRNIPLHIKDIMKQTNGYLCRETALKLLVGDIPDVWNIVSETNRFLIPNDATDVKLFSMTDIPSFIESEDLHLNTLLIDQQGELIDYQDVQGTIRSGIHIFNLDPMKISGILEKNTMTIMDYLILHSIVGIELFSCHASRRIKRYSSNLIRYEHGILRDKFISILSGKDLENILPMMDHCGIFRVFGIELPDIQSAIKCKKLGASPIAIMYSLSNNRGQMLSSNTVNILDLDQTIKNTYELFDTYVRNSNSIRKYGFSDWKSIIEVLGIDKSLDLGSILGEREYKKVVAAIESS